MQLFWPKQQGFEAVLANVQQQSPLKPFSPEALQFTQALSKRFIRLRHMPEVVALGYWLRKANIVTMQKAWQQNTSEHVYARGTSFHIAPSNVDTIFVYSWMLSLLAGNRNIIRVSSKEQQGLNDIMQIIIETLAEPAFKAIAERTIICTYEHSENATAEISALCHTRVIWGGDATIKKIRQVPLAPMANELAFPDRFSLATIAASEVLEALDIAPLIEAFYNDVFWFDQMACSSPRLVVWVGSEQEIAQAKEIFWAQLAQKIKAKHYELMSATQVLKLSTSLWLAAENQVSAVANTQYFSRLQLQDVPSAARERHCGGGLFYEYDVAELSDFAPYVVDKDQTLAYYGHSKQTLRTFLQAVSTRGIDRIVPIGQALNFDGVWDGQNFLTSFTREVVMI